MISANGVSGVLLHDGASRNILSNKLIGIDVTGLIDLGNSVDGVIIENAPENYVGGDFFDSGVVGNVISGNDRHGVHLLDGDAFDNVIGAATGLASVSMARHLFPTSPAAYFVDRAPNNTIGSADEPPQGNVIAYNGEDGVTVKETTGSPSGGMRCTPTADWRLTWMTMACRPTTSPDDDPGANELRNFPQILAAVNADVTYVTGNWQVFRTRRFGSSFSPAWIAT